MLEEKVILLVSAEEKTRTELRAFMDNEGITFVEAGDCKKAREYFRCQNSVLDLLILDIDRLGHDGWNMCREIRKESELPVIVLASTQRETDEVYGFEIGINDYISKSSSPTVLRARVQAIFRRKDKDRKRKMSFSKLEIDDSFHRVTSCGREINLSPKEYNLLLLLAENEGRIISREELLRKVWGYYYYGGLRTIDTHINRLRIKLGDGGDSIQTIRGFGYRFED